MMRESAGCKQKSTNGFDYRNAYLERLVAMIRKVWRRKKREVGSRKMDTSQRMLIDVLPSPNAEHLYNCQCDVL